MFVLPVVMPMKRYYSCLDSRHLVMMKSCIQSYLSLVKLGRSCANNLRKLLPTILLMKVGTLCTAEDIFFTVWLCLMPLLIMLLPPDTASKGVIFSECPSTVLVSPFIRTDLVTTMSRKMAEAISMKRTGNIH